MNHQARYECKHWVQLYAEIRPAGIATGQLTYVADAEKIADNICDLLYNKQQVEQETI
jgi:hypothetical protein